MNLYENDVLQDVCEFITSLHEQTNYDYVICIERGGLALYDDAIEHCLSNKHNKIPFFSGKAIGRLDLNGKNILLFDDCARTGKQICKTQRKLIQRGATNVDTATFVKLNSSNPKSKDIKAKHVVDEKTLATHDNRIRNHFNQRLLSFDSDHINVLGHFEKPITYEQLSGSLSELGNIAKTKSLLFPNEKNNQIHKITIKNIKFLDWKKLDLPSYITSMATWKVRIIFHESGKICIFPLAYPEITPDSTHPGTHNFPWCFCEKYLDVTWKKRFDDPEWYMSCCCVVFHLSSLLLERFLQNWIQTPEIKQHNLILERVKFQDARSLFGDPKIELHLKERLSKSCKEVWLRQQETT